MEVKKDVFAFDLEAFMQEIAEFIVTFPQFFDSHRIGDDREFRSIDAVGMAAKANALK